jgi:DNA-binding transcriptional ArsR family regulator
MTSASGRSIVRLCASSFWAITTTAITDIQVTLITPSTTMTAIRPALEPTQQNPNPSPESSRSRQLWRKCRLSGVSSYRPAAITTATPRTVTGSDYIVSKMANDVFGALAHPLRREIVERLSTGPASVGEVTRDFGVSKPTISRHLRLLEEAGVVSRVVVGRQHRLALRGAALAEAEAWIEQQRTRWERVFDVVGEYLEERRESR